MKLKLLSLALLFAGQVFAQNVTIPDANFKTILVNNYDTNTDGEISTTEAAAVTGTINAIGASISDVTGIEAFVNITGLNVENNTIATIDLSMNTKLTTVDVDNNKLKLLNLSTLADLQFLFADANEFYYLDLSNNSNLLSVVAKNNPTMTGVNLANGNISNIIQVELNNNTNLTCIQVDAATVATPPAGWIKDATASYSVSCDDFRYVNIPDPVFKAALLNNTVRNVNTNGDSEIQYNEAANITGDIDLVGLGITDITGIEAFTGILRLGLWNDQISGTVNLTQNTNLQYVTVNNTKISSLILSNITVSINLKNNTNLTNVDLSNSSNLIAAYVNNNALLTSIDFSQSPNMTFIDISDSSISTLNLGTKNSLDGILANRTSLSGNFDFSTYPSLRNLQMIGHANSNITGLNVANGNNTNFNSLNITSNPNLLCVQVDDVNLVTNASWSQEDSTTTYSEDCSALLCWVNIPDTNFKTELVNNSSINTNGDTEIQCAEAAAYTGTITVAGKNIADLTGIEAFVNITGLTCFGNQLTTLDLSANTQLTSLLCNVNQLTSLNVANGNNTNFTNFNASSNTGLTCIQVDDANYSTTNWTNKDATASYSENCSSLSISDANLLKELQVYPNPSKGMVHVKTNEAVKKIKVFNYLGEQLLETNNATVNLTDLAKGVYLIKITTVTNKTGVKQIVKQ